MNPKPEELPPRRKKWWQTNDQEKTALITPDPPRHGDSCPKCQMADLDFDTLFRLHCPVCGFVASCGAFT